ncbi:MAG: DNA-binding transcriptional regulator OxyR [Candidatus Nephrothrix sp. EaCA]|nr:MAG: DNA-binding transcriptional regulator OxyR [Candidatus Nephrothrix sp. EaCA]
MTLQQLEYIAAIDAHRNFVSAAADCCVTQATLSMMVKKLEEEIGVKIFDRSKIPVVPTAIGSKIIEQAKAVLYESARIGGMVREESKEISGELRIGIIPTLAPYLLPRFIVSFLKKNQGVKLKISELTTQVILDKLTRQQLDAGIAAIPAGHKFIKEQSLFFEEFVLYASAKHPVLKKNEVQVKDIDPQSLWLINEEHCFHHQLVNLCKLKERERKNHPLDFSAAGIETVRKLADINGGMTILPALAAEELPRGKKENNLRSFKPPVPSREIGFLTSPFFVKEKLLNALKNEIVNSVPPSCTNYEKRNVQAAH